MKDFICTTSGAMTTNFCGSASMFSKPAGRSASTPSASRMVSLNLAASAVSRTIIGTPGAMYWRATLIPSAVWVSIVMS